MPSDLGRGFKFGVGFALGMSVVMGLFLFGISMCAGRFHRHLMEQMREQMEEMAPQERPPGRRPLGTRLLSQPDEARLFLATGGQAMVFETDIEGGSEGQEERSPADAGGDLWLVH